MTAIPMKDAVLCELVEGKDREVEENGVIFWRKDDLKVYNIVSASKQAQDAGFEANDKILCNATGTLMNLGGTRMYLFNVENIAGKIEK